VFLRLKVVVNEPSVKMSSGPCDYTNGAAVRRVYAFAWKGKSR
jgi:hypothetical protein